MNMAPTVEVPRATLSEDEIENRINEKLDEAISKLHTAKNYMIMLKDDESADRIDVIIHEIDTFFKE